MISKIQTPKPFRDHMPSKELKSNVTRNIIPISTNGKTLYLKLTGYKFCLYNLIGSNSRNTASYGITGFYPTDSKLKVLCRHENDGLVLKIAIVACIEGREHSKKFVTDYNGFEFCKPFEKNNDVIDPIQSVSIDNQELLMVRSKYYRLKANNEVSEAKFANEGVFSDFVFRFEVFSVGGKNLWESPDIWLPKDLSELTCRNHQSATGVESSLLVCNEEKHWVMEAESGLFFKLCNDYPVLSSECEHIKITFKGGSKPAFPGVCTMVDNTGAKTFFNHEGILTDTKHSRKQFLGCGVKPFFIPIKDLSGKLVQFTANGTTTEPIYISKHPSHILESEGSLYIVIMELRSITDSLYNDSESVLVSTGTKRSTIDDGSVCNFTKDETTPNRNAKKKKTQCDDCIIKDLEELDDCITKDLEEFLMENQITIEPTTEDITGSDINAEENGSYEEFLTLHWCAFKINRDLNKRAFDFFGSLRDRVSESLVDCIDSVEKLMRQGVVNYVDDNNNPLYYYIFQCIQCARAIGRISVDISVHLEEQIKILTEGPNLPTPTKHSNTTFMGTNCEPRFHLYPFTADRFLSDTERSALSMFTRHINRQYIKEALAFFEWMEHSGCISEPFLCKIQRLCSLISMGIVNYAQSIDMDEGYVMWFSEYMRLGVWANVIDEEDCPYIIERSNLRLKSRNHKSGLVVKRNY